MKTLIANTDMAAAWDGEEGENWASHWQWHDRAVGEYQEPLFSAAGITSHDDVLDVGCGNGQSTRLAASTAADGHATGIDLSSRMLDRARELAGREGLRNISFVRGDAQVYPFEPGTYDLVLSRFGVMFFGDQEAAFTNIARAIRPGGRLAMVAWQSLEANEWLREIREALALGRELAVPPSGAPGPFGLADQQQTQSVLTKSAFRDITIEACKRGFLVGQDMDEAFRFMSSSGLTRGLLADLDPEDQARALANLRSTLQTHETARGVVFGSAVWVISATRA